jgi:hypothetical protein
VLKKCIKRMPLKKSSYSKKPTTTRRRTYRRTKTVKGKGAYSYNKPGPWGKVGRAAGSIIGRHFGGSTGASIGSRVGGLAHYIGRVFGSGEYKIGPAPKVNSLFKGSTRPSQLSFGDRYVNLKHREFIGDVVTSSTAGAFSLQSFAINPGLRHTFPYLNAIARNFQMYRFKGLIFEFVSTSGTGLTSTNTALGTVTITPEYNVASKPPKGKHEMLNTDGAVSGKPSDSLLCGIECDPRKGNNREMFVRALHTTDISRDRRVSDLANLYVGTYGMQGTSINVGQLFVTYDVDLMMPVTEAPGKFDPQTEIIFQGSASNNLPANWPFPAFNDYAGSPSYNITDIKEGYAYNGLGVILRWQSGTQESLGGGSYICFPRETSGGHYRITYIWTGASAAMTAPGTQSLNGLTQHGLSYDTNGSTNERWMFHYNVFIPETCKWTDDLTGVTWPSFQLYGGSLPSGLETGRINVIVTRLNPDLLETCLPPGATGNDLIV